MKPVTISETADGKYWIKTYEFDGMTGKGRAVALMPNGDIVVVGTVKGKRNHSSNGFVARFDKDGNVKWAQIIGGSKDDEFNDVKVAFDGDIIVVGQTESFGSSGKDAWVLRLDGKGDIIWQKTYGGKNSDWAKVVAIAPNGDIIVAGPTESFGAGHYNVWVLRLDSNGNVKWQKTYGGKDREGGEAVALAPNGDIIIAGYTFSFGYDQYHYDIWVLRLDSEGNVKWQKTYGGGSGDEAKAVAIAPNGDIIVAGTTNSFGAGSDDFWILRLDPYGNVKWQKTYGGSHSDKAYEVAIAENEDIIVVGETWSFGAGKSDVWVLRLDSNGNVKWQKTYGGNKYDEAYAVAIAPNEDIIIAGYTNSFNNGGNTWLLRLPPDGEIPNCKIWKDTNATVMDTRAVVKNTNCKVTVPPLKPGLLRKEYVKITDTTANVREVVSKVEIQCEWTPGELAERAFKKTRGKPCPGYIINDRCYIVKAMVMDESGLRSALEELDEALDGHLTRPLPDEIILHPFSDTIEGEGLFVWRFRTEYIISSGPKESGLRLSEWFSEQLIEIMDRIKKATIPESGASGKMGGALMAKQEIETETTRIFEVSKITEKTESEDDVKTIEGFPSALLTRYEPIEFLGEGGFAKVFKARRKEDGKIVALKIPGIDERTSGLFIKEVAAWYNLNHENIVRLYRADILPVPYLEMEFVEGVEIDGKLIRNLGTYLKPVDEKTALELIRGIATGLKHAHSKGIYHLDLKPENVLLKADMTPKITDWGLAQISARSSLSKHYGYSPLYAAPEQLDEEIYGEPDHRTDIYQIGLILYELLTGDLPYRATSPGALFWKILQAKPKPVSEFKPELKKFEGLFERLLAKEKENRYQSVDEFLSTLDSMSELEREKEELRKTSLAMRKSRSRKEFERLKVESVRKTVKIALLSARLNDKAELLVALDDLKFYTRENLDDLLSAIEQVELLLREGIPISAEVEERLRALVLRIEGEALSK